MKDNGRPGAEQSAALAALLRAVAEAGVGAQGRSVWNGLVAVLGSQDAGPDDQREGEAELAALREEPGFPRRAELLARVLLQRAEADEQFRAVLSQWRGQAQVRAIENVVNRRPLPSGRPGDGGLGTTPIISENSATPGRETPIVGATITGDVKVQREDETAARTSDASSQATSGSQDDDRRDVQPWRSFWSSLWTITIIGGAAAGLIIWAVTTAISSSGAPAPSHPAGIGRPSASRSSLTPPSPGSTVSGFAPNSPAKVEGVIPPNPAPDDSWALAKPVQLTDRQIAQISARPEGAYALPASLAPAALNSGFIEITVTGNAKGIVTVNNLLVRKQCTAPLTGTLFFSPSQGVNGTIGLGFDLDSQIDYARHYGGYGHWSGNFFEGDVVTLAPGETHTFTIFVSSVKSYCSFTLQMSVVTPGGVITEAIDDNGKPFQITGLQPKGSSSYKALYVGGIEALLRHLNKNGHWVREDPKTFHD